VSTTLSTAQKARFTDVNLLVYKGKSFTIVNLIKPMESKPWADIGLLSELRHPTKGYCVTCKPDATRRLSLNPKNAHESKAENAS
jgi:hypothetical protein